MTTPVTFPAPIINREVIDNHVVVFLQNNPQGVRNCDVGRAIGVNDSRQWFSYGVLDRLIRNGRARKTEESLYFAVTQD